MTRPNILSKVRDVTCYTLNDQTKLFYHICPSHLNIVCVVSCLVQGNSPHSIPRPEKVYLSIFFKSYYNGCHKESQKQFHFHFHWSFKLKKSVDHQHQDHVHLSERSWLAENTVPCSVIAKHCNIIMFKSSKKLFGDRQTLQIMRASF